MIVIKRACLVFAITFFMSLGLHSNVFANESMSMDFGIEPFWTDTTLFTIDLSINNNGRARMTGMVLGNLGTSHIISNVSLHRINSNGSASLIASFNNIRANGDIWVWERDHFVQRGHDYQVTITATVFRNGSSETITRQSRIVRAH